MSPAHSSQEFRLAVITTAYHTFSHSDAIVSRWLEHRPADRLMGWDGPRSRIVSLFVDQPDFSPQDRRALARETCIQHGISFCPTIAEALCLGGDKLAVDGILLIAEHGKYPLNVLQQKLYPRKAFFDQIVDVFRQTGQTAGLFCDKFFSWNFDWAREMYETARRMNFLLVGGSSIVCTHATQPLEFRGGDQLDSAVAIFYGPRESYGYHSIEQVQAVLEQRAGGETGIRSITAYRGAAARAFLQSPAAPRPVLLARTLQSCNTAATVDVDTALALCGEKMELFVVDRLDGLRATHLNLDGVVAEWAIGLSVGTDASVTAAAAVMGTRENYFLHFAGLARTVENALLTNTPSFPARRSLLTSGTVAAMCRAFANPGESHLTPELHLPYTILT